jgi:hypothetical protein
MPVTGNAIDYHGEIDKLFDSINAAVRAGSAVTYVLPAQIAKTADLRNLTASDEEAINKFKSDRKSASTNSVSVSKEKVEKVFRSGVGDTQAGHDQVDDIFNQQDAEYQQQSDEARKQSHETLDRLSPGAQDGFLKLLKAWGPTFVGLFVSLFGVIKDAVKWLAEAIEKAVNWIVDRAKELWGTITGWFGG